MSRAGWTVRLDGSDVVEGPFSTRREALVMSGIATPIAQREQWGDGAYTYRTIDGMVVHIERGAK